MDLLRGAPRRISSVLLAAAIILPTQAAANGNGQGQGRSDADVSAPSQAVSITAGNIGAVEHRGADGWTSGNLNRTNSAYAELDGIPVRVALHNLVTGTEYGLTIAYETHKNGSPAYSHLDGFVLVDSSGSVLGDVQAQPAVSDDATPHTTAQQKLSITPNGESARLTFDAYLAEGSATTTGAWGVRLVGTAKTLTIQAGAVASPDEPEDSPDPADGSGDPTSDEPAAQEGTTEQDETGSGDGDAATGQDAGGDDDQQADDPAANDAAGPDAQDRDEPTDAEDASSPDDDGVGDQPGTGGDTEAQDPTDPDPDDGSGTGDDGSGTGDDGSGTGDDADVDATTPESTTDDQPSADADVDGSDKDSGPVTGDDGQTSQEPDDATDEAGPDDPAEQVSDDDATTDAGQDAVTEDTSDPDDSSEGPTTVADTSDDSCRGRVEVHTLDVDGDAVAPTSVAIGAQTLTLSDGTTTVAHPCGDVVIHLTAAPEGWSPITGASRSPASTHHVTSTVRADQTTTVVFVLATASVTDDAPEDDPVLDTSISDEPDAPSTGDDEVTPAPTPVGDPVDALTVDPAPDAGTPTLPRTGAEHTRLGVWAALLLLVGGVLLRRTRPIDV